MVWIFGGLWKHGAARMPHYDAAALAAAGVVVVTVNYRVGFEGFGHLPGVPDNRGRRIGAAADGQSDSARDDGWKDGRIALRVAVRELEHLVSQA